MPTDMLSSDMPPSDMPPVGMPRVSWIVPVYNGEDYLALTLKSIHTQTFKDFEVLVLDDGSTDGSARIAQDFARRDPRFRVISKDNTGLTDTLNVGLTQARGEYICRLDADDIALPQRCQIQIDYLDCHPGCVLVASRAILIDEHGTVTGHSGAARLEPAGMGGYPPARQAFRHPTVMGRRSAFLSLGGYSEDYPAAEDYELWLRMRSLGEMVELDDYLIQYRYHAQSISSTQVIRQVLSCAKAEVAVCLRNRGGADDDVVRIEAVQTPEALFTLLDTLKLEGVSVPSVEIYYRARALRLMRHRGRPREARAMAADLGKTLLRHGPATLFQSKASSLTIAAAKELARYWLRTLGRRVA